MDRLACGIIIFLMLGVTTGALVHAVAPHDHANGSDAIEMTMHAALRADDDAAMIDVGFVLVIALITVFYAVRSIPAFALVPIPIRELRRGIPQHRRFV